MRSAMRPAMRRAIANIVSFKKQIKNQAPFP
jgi:hypothetical protein